MRGVYFLYSITFDVALSMPVYSICCNFDDAKSAEHYCYYRDNKQNLRGGAVIIAIMFTPTIKTMATLSKFHSFSFSDLSDYLYL